MNPSLDMAARQRLRDYLAERLGLQLGDDRLPELSRALRERAATWSMSESAYGERLAREGFGRDELGHLASALTISETYFFRDMAQLRVVTDLLEALSKARPERPVRVLSAGCATGAEPYTVVMLARGRGLAPQALAVLAVDVDPASLRAARTGRYSAWSLRQTPPALRELYFVRCGATFELDPSIRQQVTFERRNLAEPEPGLWAAGPFDVILCRNVLMYLTAEAIHPLVARFAKALTAEGILVVGAAESLRGVTDALALHPAEGAFFYRKHQADPAPLASPGSTSAQTPSRAPTPRQTRANDPRADVEPPPEALRPAPSARSQEGERGPEAAHALFDAERFEDVVRHLAELTEVSSADQLLRGVALLNLGEVAAARALASTLVDDHTTGASAHYLIALCDELAENEAGAVEHHRAAAYLDDTFALPHLRLGRLLNRRRETLGARRELALALALLENEAPGRVRLFGGGFSKKALLDLCRAELRVCQERA